MSFCARLLNRRSTTFEFVFRRKIGACAMRFSFKKKITLYCCLVLLCSQATSMYAARIKDIATVEGVNGTQVIGYGLVTGLVNTGDNQRASMTIQSVVSMLKRFGVTIPQQTLRTRNVAAVMVTANVPSFLKKGQRFDVQVSSLGDALSLQGGVLLMTPLSGPDGTVYGMAQGALSVGGYDFRANDSRVGKNYTGTGRVPNGGAVEKEIPGQIAQNQSIRIVLREPDFTTSTRVAAAINRAVGAVNNAASSVDAATIQIPIPSGYNQNQIVQLVSQIESQQVTTDPVAKVVINERTGTIVIGGAVELLPAAISHGGLDIQIQTETKAVQPPPLSISDAKIVKNSRINVQEEKNQVIVMRGGSNVNQIADALNALKVTSRDLIAIFQALKEAGSLQAELIIQ